MDLKFLLAALLTVTAVPAPEPVVVSLPDFTLNADGSEALWAGIRASETHPDADVLVRVDATAIASIAKVTTDTAGCVAKANVITCARTMTVGQDGEGLVRILIAGKGKAGTGKLTMTATVDGALTGTAESTVTVIHPPKLVMVGAKVKAPGQTRVAIKVGIRNTGAGPADFPPTAPNLGAIVYYVRFPANTHTAYVGGHCFPWGVGFDGWEWNHPAEPGYNQYACTSGGRLEPRATVLLPLVMVIDPRYPVVTGEISYRNGEVGPASIVIDTRETLPVTGPKVRDIAAVAVALIVPGTLLVMVGRRSRRSRRSR